MVVEGNREVASMLAVGRSVDMYNRIIIPLDGSQFAERVLPHVEAIAAKFDSTLMLVRSVPTEALIMGQSMAVMPLAGGLPVDNQYSELTTTVATEEKTASVYLQQVATRLRDKGFRVKCIEPEGRPAECILNEARIKGADLIAMTTHGRGGLSRLFVGSVADEVLRLSTCPVLLVRSDEPARPGNGHNGHNGHNGPTHR